MADHARLEARERHIVEVVFRWGLVVSALSMASGLVLRIASGSPAVEAIDFAHLGAMSGAEELMAIGIGVLTATPAITVFLLMVLWARHRRLRLALVAITVLATLTVAMFVGNG